MPGVVPSYFQNPYRTSTPAALRVLPGLTVLNLFEDIILPDVRSAGPPNGRPPGIVVGQLGDDEADEIRRVTARPNEPRYSTRDDGGPPYLTDVTWAFNQASGARPEVADLHSPAAPVSQQHEQTYAVDPLTGESIYTINPFLPSLNRQPGIIFVPSIAPEVYNVFGTITLFAGQHILGVAPVSGGSEIVKIGDGAAIRVQDQLDFASDPFRTLDDAVAAMASDDAATVTWAWQQILMQLDREGADDQIRAVLARLVGTQGFAGTATCRISSVYIRQQDIPARQARSVEDNLRRFAPDGAGGFEPAAAAVGDLTLRSGAITTDTQLRSLPIAYSSFGIDLPGPAFTIIEDVKIEGFRNGVGIHVRPRNVAHNQESYYNQIRRCEVVDCDRGILMQDELGYAVESHEEGEGAAKHTVFDGLHGAGNEPNSTIISDCHVSNFGRAGIEVWGPTTWLLFCSVCSNDAGAADDGDAAPIRACAVLPNAYAMVYRCRFATDDVHVLMPPTPLFDPIPGADALAIRRRPTGDSTGDISATATAVVHCSFYDSGNHPSAPRVKVVEFPDSAYPERPGVDPARRLLLDAWDHSGNGPLGANIVEWVGPGLSPSSWWTSENLLYNADFGSPEKLETLPRSWQTVPTGWTWLNVSANNGTPPPNPVGPEYRSSTDREFLGRIVVVEFPFVPAHWEWVGGHLKQVAAGYGTVRSIEQSTCLEYLLIPGLPAANDEHRDAKFADALARRTVVRGKRLVGSCWVRANYPGAVGVTFREGDTPPSEVAWNSRHDTWMRVTAACDPWGQDYPERNVNVGRTRKSLFEVALRIIVRPPSVQRGLPPAGESGVVMIGGPQVNLGPELFPLGPQFASSETPRVGGDMLVSRGVGLTLGLRLHDRAAASTPIGSDCRLETLRAVAEAGGVGTYKLVIERGGRQVPISDVTIRSAGVTDIDVAGVQASELLRGDLITFARADGRAAPVEILLRTRGSRTI